MLFVHNFSFVSPWQNCPSVGRPLIHVHEPSVMSSQASYEWHVSFGQTNSPSHLHWYCVSFKEHTEKQRKSGITNRVYVVLADLQTSEWFFAKGSWCFDRLTCWNIESCNFNTIVHLKWKYDRVCKISDFTDRYSFRSIHFNNYDVFHWIYDNITWSQ